MALTKVYQGRENWTIDYEGGYYIGVSAPGLILILWKIYQDAVAQSDCEYVPEEIEEEETEEAE